LVPARPRPQESFRAKSIKTRIETGGFSPQKTTTGGVLEQNPSKQGLKHGLELLDFNLGVGF